MPQSANRLLRATLSALHYSGAGDVFAPLTAGRGVIFMLHHVTPEAPEAFAPNRILKVTPDFLERVIVDVKEAGFDIISLDAVADRLAAPADRPFAVFTLDDGYKDNREHAYPIFKKHAAPFTIYVPTDYADGLGDLWWLALEDALKVLDAVTVTIDGQQRTYGLASDADKDLAFDEIYWSLRARPERDARALVRGIAELAGIDQGQMCRDLVMSWDELRLLASDPLVTIGAHTRAHYALAKLDAARVRAEISYSIARIEQEIGRPCRHFSYPYGCEASAGEREFDIARELGVVTAVTTRKGLLHEEHAAALTALPRLSLNGDFQDAHYVRVLLSGLPFALLDVAKRAKDLVRPRRKARAA